VIHWNNRPHRSRVARMGEFLAAYLLESHGIEAVHVDRDQADLWVRTPSGRLMTVQVKAASRPIPRQGRQPRYHWSAQTLAGADVFAMVALDTRLMVIFPAAEVGTSFTLSPSQFTEERQLQSIEEYLA
jgi:hypothetical protein